MKSRAVVWLFVGIALVYALLVPPFEAPDEPDHLAYINFIAERGLLPNQYDSDRAVPREGHQPPLYYALGALIVRFTQPDNRVDVNPIPHRPPDLRYPPDIPIYRHVGQPIFPTPADRVGFYLLRLMSVLLATLNVALAIRLVGVLFAHPHSALPTLNPPEKERIQLALVFLLGIPQFAFISGVINNDNLANLLATAVLLSLLCLLRGENVLWRWAGVGILLGLGLLAKKTLLFLLPLVGVVAWLQLRAFGRKVLVGLLIALGAIGLVSGWWFYRNWVLYGDWSGTAMEVRTLPELVDEKPLFSRYFLASFWRVLFGSAIAGFGWMNVVLPRPVYWVAWLILGVSLLGLIRAWKRTGIPLRLALLAVGLCVAGIVYYNLTFTQPQGRFLFPVLTLLCGLLAWGISAWWDGRVPRWVLLFAIGLATAFHLISWATLYLFYYPEHRYILPEEGYTR